MSINYAIYIKVQSLVRLTEMTFRFNLQSILANVRYCNMPVITAQFNDELVFYSGDKRDNLICSEINAKIQFRIFLLYS